MRSRSGARKLFPKSHLDPGLDRELEPQEKKPTMTAVKLLFCFGSRSLLHSASTTKSSASVATIKDSKRSSQAVRHQNQISAGLNILRKSGGCLPREVFSIKYGGNANIFNRLLALKFDGNVTIENDIVRLLPSPALGGITAKHPFAPSSMAGRCHRTLLPAKKLETSVPENANNVTALSSADGTTKSTDSLPPLNVIATVRKKDDPAVPFLQVSSNKSARSPTKFPTVTPFSPGIFCWPSKLCLVHRRRKRCESSF